MGILSEITRESDAQFICAKIKKLIERHENSPEVVSVLKGLGIEILDELLYAIPEWSRDYYKLFRS